jgi:antitoxin VapB
MMTLELENVEAERLAHELSRLTGESVTAVATKALADRLARERAAREEAAKIKAFAQRIRPDYDTRPVAKAEWDEAYGDAG